jgi:uncharacterized protein
MAGDLLAGDSARVTRRFHALVGHPTRGSAVDLGAYPYGADPKTAHDIAFEQVIVHGGIGNLPAWFIPGTRDTWVVFVPGMAAGRGEALRAIPTIAALHYPMLVISYRNGPGAPRSKDGLYHLGAEEWKDLQAATRHAMTHGAKRVVLFGFSMGGTIAANLLDRSVLDHDVAGVIFDAPVLDWDAAVQLAARRRHVPAFLTALAEGLVTRRTQFDWNGTEGKVRASEFSMPVLLFHGTADGTVPIAPSESLAVALGDRVTFVKTPGAGHVQSWNFDPDGYERALRAWLPRVAPDSL